MIADHANKSVDSLDLTTVMFISSTVVSLIAALFFEPDQWIYPYSHIVDNSFWIILMGVIEGVGFTLCNSLFNRINTKYRIIIRDIDSLSYLFIYFFFLKKVISAKTIV